MTDKSPFFIRPYCVKEEDKNFIDKEMMRICYLGILTERFSAYSSPVMLISRMVMKDERVVTELWTFNCKNSQKQLGISIIKEYIFSIVSS